VTKAENQLNDFIIHTYQPIVKRFENVEAIVAAPATGTIIRLVPDMGHVKPLVDAVIYLEEGLDPVNASLRKNPLQKTLEIYPATSVIAQRSGLPKWIVVNWTEMPVKELSNPYADYYVGMLDMFGKDLYVDDRGKPLLSVIGRDGEYTTDPAKIFGHVVAVSDVLSVNKPDWRQEIESRIILLNYGLEASKTINYYLSFDPWIKTGEFIVEAIDKTIFYCGAASVKLLEWLSYIDIGSTNPEELEDQAKELENWSIEEIRSAADYWADLYVKQGYSFIFTPGA